MSTRDRLKNRKRPARLVAIDGGEPLHARDLTPADLRDIDARAEGIAEGREREVRRVELMALFALSEPDGVPTFPDRKDSDLETLALLTPAEIRAVAEASVPSRTDAKND